MSVMERETTVEPANPAPNPAPEPKAAIPSHDVIARLAYSYWLERGDADGSAEEDWLRAERELREKKSSR